ncbi:TraS protein [Salmonella enterica subsp. enterica serovar Newport]|uniref:TraS protein n=1 Tax=Salmonella enterica subsp. enterica serovar Newport str. CDC 2010K-2159 TaxID=1454627 RepID=A0A2H4YPS7_SALNE|nr:TraS protein [Salmonella enterica subsp. enterica serovar Newport str. CDC 2010K-2159]EBX2373771.1 TraS protein [Salmonella enterica subsp. enterica serovar Typhimurium]ECO0811245.1 TraS protein [Salmonella enterica subsp. enterica serovar Newport]EDV4605173.1 TraS protein [Salmonella enterica subsp. enterica]EIZ1473997.1 TraS protein [Salmonella enterica]
MHTKNLDNFTLLRTENGNVIARDNRDNQEFVFAECYSREIASVIMEAVKRYCSTEIPHATKH